MTATTGFGSEVRSLTTAELRTVLAQEAREARRLTAALGCDTDERGGIRIRHEHGYDVWLLRWPPGTRVTPHDHGDSSGAFLVLDGDLIELRWQDSIPECRLVSSGETVLVERGVVHDVVATNRVAYSIHAYSPPLEAMSFYQVPFPTADTGGSPDAWRAAPLGTESVSALIGD
ncbi:MAG TPA: cysteine dioxygenase family protein [Acidimicrobiales bacterium]|nr:cysteine dioxygenase family protein [Acidimicrobiales bacterium]